MHQPCIVGQYMSDASRTKLLTAAEETDLASRIRNGNIAARNLLVVSNLRLAMSVAKHYQGMGLDLADLIEEGNLGLIDAANRFDPSRGTRFSTYATWWIRQKIFASLSRNGGAFRTPDYIRRTSAKWRRAHKGLCERLGRQPEESEVAQVLGVRKSTVLLARMADLSRGAQAISDEMQLVEKGDFCDPEKAAERQDEHRKLALMMDRLTENEAKVLRMYFNESLDGPAIARAMGISKAWVHQLKTNGLKKLRKMMCNDK